MVIARKHQIPQNEVVTTHVYARVVRRGFLLGTDLLTGRNYDHRKEWVRKRMKSLVSIFSVEACGYAVLSNHYHAILRARPDVALAWTPYEVAERWWQLFPKRRDNYGNPASPKDHELDELLCDKKLGIYHGRVETLRNRLSSISWFMRCLNETIARRANKEDGCTGRFWEGRFKSVTLVDQAAVLACMAYVDLNPIHAGMAQTPEESDFTSGQDRIQSQVSKETLQQMRARYHEEQGAASEGTLSKMSMRKASSFKEELRELQGELKLKALKDAWLSPISLWPLDQSLDHYASFLNMNQNDYFKVLDWTGRQFRSDKRGKIPEELKPILKRMDIEVENWLGTVENFGSWFHYFAGKLESLKEMAQKVGQKWLAGKRKAEKAFIAPKPSTPPL